jgi:calcineurin-like phosphoesterase family protein
MRYFSADWHVGHANCLKFDSRPFRDLDHMHSVLINNYTASVKANDICFFLGDIGWGKHNALASIISALPGTKILIRGNHDRGEQAMLGVGFHAVLNTASITIAGQVVTLSHCPLRGVYRENTENMRGAAPGDNWHGERKHLSLSLPDNGQFHLHGHIHSNSNKPSSPPTIGGRQWDVGVVGNNYRPVSESQIESWISRSKKGVV